MDDPLSAVAAHETWRQGRSPRGLGPIDPSPSLAPRRPGADEVDLAVLEANDSATVATALGASGFDEIAAEAAIVEQLAEQRSFAAAQVAMARMRRLSEASALPVGLSEVWAARRRPESQLEAAEVARRVAEAVDRLPTEDLSKGLSGRLVALREMPDGLAVEHRYPRSAPSDDEVNWAALADAGYANLTKVLRTADQAASAEPDRALVQEAFLGAASDATVPAHILERVIDALAEDLGVSAEEVAGAITATVPEMRDEALQRLRGLDPLLPGDAESIPTDTVVLPVGLLDASVPPGRVVTEMPDGSVSIAADADLDPPRHLTRGVKIGGAVRWVPSQPAPFADYRQHLSHARNGRSIHETFLADEEHPALQPGTWVTASLPDGRQILPSSSIQSATMMSPSAIDEPTGRATRGRRSVRRVKIQTDDPDRVVADLRLVDAADISVYSDSPVKGMHQAYESLASDGLSLVASRYASGDGRHGSVVWVDTTDLPEPPGEGGGVVRSGARASTRSGLTVDAGPSAEFGESILDVTVDGAPVDEFSYAAGVLVPSETLQGAPGPRVSRQGRVTTDAEDATEAVHLVWLLRAAGIDAELSTSGGPVSVI